MKKRTDRNNNMDKNNKSKALLTFAIIIFILMFIPLFLWGFSIPFILIVTLPLILAIFYVQFKNKRNGRIPIIPKIILLLYILLLIPTLYLFFAFMNTFDVSIKDNLFISNSVNFNKPVNISICGTDDRNGILDTNTRCDSIMIISINFKNDNIDMISIPRDAYIQNSCTGELDKITHSGLEGMDCFTQTLEDYFGIKMDGYLKVNFYSVIDIIDAIGGVTIDVDSTFCGQDINDNLYAYCFEPGTTLLNGEEALSYARERKSLSGGDYARAIHQQQVFEAIGESVKNLGLANALNLVTTMSNSFRTNLSPNELMKIIKKGFKNENYQTNSYLLQGVGSSVDIPSRGLYGTSVQIIDDESKNEIIDVLNT